MCTNTNFKYKVQIRAYTNKHSPSLKQTHRWSSSMISSDCTWKQMCQCKVRSWCSAGKGWNVVPKNWSTWQCSTVTNSICKQESHQCRNTVWQHWERDALGTLHGLEKCHYYCLTHTVSMITDPKPLVAIFTKDVAALPRLQRILLQINQYNIRVLYKPGLQLCIVDWLSRHYHDEDKDEEIPGMSLSFSAVKIMCKYTRMHDGKRVQACNTRW